MKRSKGGRRGLMGQITTSTYSGSENRIQLFDGKFTTGYRILDFRVTPRNPSDGAELVAKITTEPDSGLGTWDFDNVQQLAYAGWNMPFNSRFSEFKLIRPDNMAVEDLWIQIYNPAEAVEANYYIVLEKYEFAAWD